MKVNTRVIEWVTIETPHGTAKIEKMVWASENKMFANLLNLEFGVDHELVTHSTSFNNMAQFILADQATRKYGGKITKVKKKTITVEVEENAVE